MMDSEMKLVSFNMDEELERMKDAISKDDYKTAFSILKNLNKIFVGYTCGGSWEKKELTDHAHAFLQATVKATSGSV